ncbi:MAG: hypothetical protein PHT69_02580 [Bacteroidales bacterium]|nr:hypothetical protein [Bacteroidales bacterium]
MKNPSVSWQFLKIKLKKQQELSKEWEQMNNYPSGNSGNPYKRKIEDIKLKIKTLKQK